MKKFIYVFCSVLLILSSLYFLVAEFISVFNCGCFLPAYYKHTISDLCVPFSVTGFSSHYKVMVSAFLVMAPSSFICYNVLYLKQLKNCKLLCFTFSLLLFAGLLIVGIFNCETQVALHYIGAFLTFSSCNTLVLLTVINCKLFNKTLKKFAYFISIFGVVSSILTISLKQTMLFPVFERLTVYPVMLFCLLSGYLFLKELILNKNFSQQTLQNAK